MKTVFVGGLLSVLLLAGCGAQSGTTATLDYDALAASVQQDLAATLTAQAPPPPTSTPTAVPIAETPVPEETWTPSPTLPLPTVASDQGITYVRIGEELATNIVLTDLGLSSEQQLTHFVEPLNMSDVSWSEDGESLVFVSAHDYIWSRDQERNVFMMKADGSDLQMVTGGYVSADEAEGPFVTLSGTVEDAGAGCLVMAQGATSPVLTDENGAFELPGVPVSAGWVRAVCPTAEGSRQGTTSLDLNVEFSVPISITLQDGGQGWTQASLSPDGSRIAGSQYVWSLVDGQRAVETIGLVLDLTTGQETRLEFGEESTITALRWSPDGETLIGTIYDESGVSIVSWDKSLSEAQELVRLDNPDDIIYSAVDPAWSFDGKSVAFSLRSWYWWGDNRYKSDLVVLNLQDGSTTVVVENEWGMDARKPGWTADGSELYFQMNQASASTEASVNSEGVWYTALDDGEPQPWLEAGAGYLPAIRPIALASPSE